MKRLLYILFAVVAVLCVGCSRDDARKSILKVYNWADYIDESLLSEFEEWYFEQTGEEVEVVYQLFDINEIMLFLSSATNPYQVASSGPSCFTLIFA